MRMRRIAGTIGIFALAFVLLASCGKKAESVSMYSPAQIAEAIISAQDGISPLEPLIPGDDYFSEYMENIYQIDAGAIKDGAIYYAHGIKADEISVFRLADISYSKDIKDALMTYKERRAETFMGYAPGEAAILENGTVVTNGEYVALLICEAPQNAQSVFLACFSADPPKIDKDIVLLHPDNNNDTTDADFEADEREQFSVYDDPSSDKPDDDRPDDEKPGGDIPDETPDDEKPGDDRPTDSSPTDDKPTDASPTDDKPTDDKPTDEKPTDEKPTDEKPTDGKPTDDKPTDDKPTDEKPTDDKPTDDKPTDDKPADDKPGSDGPTVQDDIYDPASILKAWQSGDTTGLSNKNLSILDACKEVIGALIDKNMSDYEKELAIHDWIVGWVAYDEETLSNSPNAKPDPDNDNPYGALYHKKAICSGYTSTFQLFMDLLGIECITVHGSYTLTGEEHAWNMVRIGGEWYCVDVTWDDPLGNYIPADKRHEYFNVPSRYMKATRHQWDESTTPVADADQLFYG